MPTRHRRRSRFSFLVLPFALTLVAGYFSWQSTRGMYSGDGREELRAERIELEAEFERLEAVSRELQSRVLRLRTEALDADLLDERARAKLNTAHPNEMVIFHDKESSAVAVFASHGYAPEARNRP